MKPNRPARPEHCRSSAVPRRARQYSGDQLSCTTATHKGVTIQFGGGPHPEDWYGTFEAICDGSLDPLPSVGKVIGLDDVPEALDMTRRAQGPARIIVHP